MKTIAETSTLGCFRHAHGQLHTHNTSSADLSKREVLARIPFSDQQIDNLEERGEFPQRMQIGRRSVGWLESEIDDWIAAKVRQREDAVKAEEQRIARMPPGVRARYLRERDDDTAPA